MKATIVYLSFLTFFFNSYLYAQAQMSEQTQHIQISETNRIDNFITKKRAYNKTLKTGYSILLYSGIETEAHHLLAQFLENFNEIDAKLVFDRPNWKVKTNYFSTRIEAENALLKILNIFPEAKILLN